MDINSYKNFVEDLYNGLSAFYPESVFGSARGNRMPHISGLWSDSYNNRWSRDKFTDYVLTATGTGNTDEAADKIKEWKKSLDEKGVPASDMPTQDILEKAKEISEKAETEAARQKELELLFQRQNEQKTLNPQGPPKVVYIEPKNETAKPELTTDETLGLANLREAAKANPKDFISKLSNQILNNIPAEIKARVSKAELELSSNTIALDFLSRIVSGKIAVPPGIFLALVNTTDKAVSQLIGTKELKDAVSFYTYVSSKSDETAKSLLYLVVGKNIVSRFYGEEGQEFTVTDRPTSKTAFAVNLNQLQSDYARFSNNPLFNLLKQKASEEAKKRLTETGKNLITKYIGKLPGGSNITNLFSGAMSSLSGSGSTYTATSGIGQFILNFAPDYAPIISTFSEAIGVNAGITLAPVAAASAETAAVVAGGAGIEVAGAAAIAGAAGAEAAVAVGTAVAAEGVAAAAGAGIGATLSAIFGPLAPIVAPILAAIGSWIVIKLKPLIEKFKGVLLWGAVGVGGAIIGAPIVIGAGAIMAIGSAGAVATGIPLGTGVAGLTVGAIQGLISLTAASYSKSIAFSLLGIVAAVALITFIINSGAYLTPPATGIVQNLSQSPFITVTKDADTNSIPNSGLPKTVTYNLSVSAPKGSLTNISFKDDCSAVKKDSNLSCPDPDTPLPTVPTNIDPSQPFKFSYKRTFDGSFTDSLVSDTFSVTATSPDGSGTSVATASVIIGTAPTGCFSVDGDNWPANYKANVLGAIGTLTSSFQTYSAKLCHGGSNTIHIVYDTSKNPGGWGYFSGGTIYLNGGGLGSSIDALYIVSHESGHDMEFYGAPSLYTQYLDTVGVVSELPLCSYKNTTQPIEGFAEMIALYVTHDSSSQWTRLCGGSTFQSKYPSHYKFAHDNIF